MFRPAADQHLLRRPRSTRRPPASRRPRSPDAAPEGRLARVPTREPGTGTRTSPSSAIRIVVRAIAAPTRSPSRSSCASRSSAADCRDQEQFGHAVHAPRRAPEGSSDQDPPEGSGAEGRRPQEQRTQRRRRPAGFRPTRRPRVARGSDVVTPVCRVACANAPGRRRKDDRRRLREGQGSSRCAALPRTRARAVKVGEVADREEIRREAARGMDRRRWLLRSCRT